MATALTTQTNTPIEVTSALSAYQIFLLESERAYQKELVRFVDYLNGDQRAYLDERMSEVLGTDADGTPPEFRLNVCKTVIRAVTERLQLSGFTTNLPETQGGADNAADGGDAQSDAATPDAGATAWEWFNKNHLDAVSDRVHKQTLAAREYFVIVDWDSENKIPRATSTPRFIGTEAGGDDFGCIAVYENDDPDGGKLLQVIKRWRENITNEDGTTYARQRMTIYFPNRVERWVTSKLAQWEHYIDTSAAADEQANSWRVWWTDNGKEDGNALGIAAIHFRNVDGESDLSDVVSIQDLINKVLIDLAAAGDLTAFRIYKAFGINMTTDGQPLAEDKSNQLLLSPAMVVGNASKKPTDASFEAIEGANLDNLINLLKNLLVWLAMITDTPLARLQVTGQIASDKTLQGQELPLIAKIKARQKVLGASWENVFNLMLKLWNLYNKAEAFEAGTTLTVQWVDAKVLGDAERVNNAAVLAEKLKIPLVMAWRKSGQFTEDEITAMIESDEYKATLKALENGAALGGGFGADTGAPAIDG